MDQLKIFDEQSNTNDLHTISSQKLPLQSSFVILIKKLSFTNYLWITYSLGRPRNIVWGHINSPDLYIDYGCHWNEIGIINDLLRYRNEDGFITVATMAKDRIQIRILSNLIYDAYTQQTGLYYKKIELSPLEIEESIDPLDLKNSIHDLASSLLMNPNIVVITQKYIPKAIIDTIANFIEHNHILANSELSISCPLIDDCLIDPTTSCDLYRSGYSIL